MEHRVMRFFHLWWSLAIHFASLHVTPKHCRFSVNVECQVFCNLLLSCHLLVSTSWLHLQVCLLSVLVDKFCYLGDMLSVGGDADAVVEARIQIGWNKFRQWVPLLINKDISLIVRWRLYSSCMQSSVLHGSETWPVWKENKVVRWMCGVKLQGRVQSKGLRERLGLDDIILVLESCQVK